VFSQPASISVLVAQAAKTGTGPSADRLGAADGADRDATQSRDATARCLWAQSLAPASPLPSRLLFGSASSVTSDVR
jgi:hypothetical protein